VNNHPSIDVLFHQTTNADGRRPKIEIEGFLPKRFCIMPSCMVLEIRLISGYLDIFIARRVWNQRTLGYSSILYTMFNLMKEIRDKAIEELVSILTKKVEDMAETFTSNPSFSLNQQNRRYVHRLLARITYHIEQQSGIPSNYENYISSEILLVHLVGFCHSISQLIVFASLSNSSKNS
jgi:hypothetical protein